MDHIVMHTTVIALSLQWLYFLLLSGITVLITHYVTNSVPETIYL